MITVKGINGQLEPLNGLKNFKMKEEVNDSFTISFTSLPFSNNPGHDLLAEEAIVEVEGHEFRIKQFKGTRNQRNIVAVHTFFDNTGKRQTGIFGGSKSLNEFAGYVFQGTGWTFENVDVTGYVLIPEFGDDNVIKLTKALCSAFECEYKILPGKVVQFAKLVGPDRDFQYRYGHNVKELSRSVDTTRMRTKITGYGGDGLVVTYTSPNAAGFGEIEADPVRDERFTIPENLLERIKQELIDYPEISIELSSVELVDRELGERVWLIYEPMGIEFQTRVISRQSILKNDMIITESVTLGNTPPKKLQDLLSSQKIEIDETKKEVRSRIEQTNERILLEVEASESRSQEYARGQVEVLAGEVNIKTEAFNGRLTTAESSVSAIQGEIVNKVSYTEHNALGSRVFTAEQNISSLSGSISQKVSYSDYNGNTIASMINQTATTITLEAERIRQVGISEVSNELHLGGHYTDTGSKAIYFRGRLGGVVVSSPSLDTMYIGASYINIDGNVNFTGGTISGLDLTARFG